MKILIGLLSSFLICTGAQALGDTSTLKTPQSGMTDTVNTLNQVGGEEEEELPESTVHPQDEQERQYQEDVEREQEEWEESRSLDEYRYDVPE